VIIDFANLTLSYGEMSLSPLTSEHAQGLCAASAEDPSIYGFSHTPMGLEQCQQSIDQALAQRAQGLRFPFVIHWRERTVGTTSYAGYQPWSWPANSPLQRSDTPDALEIGYTWLAQSAQRTPCNTTAKYLLLQQAFEVFAVHRVSLQTDARNTVSRRAIERIGGELEGIQRGHKVAADGSLRHSAMYSILLEEWPQLKATLEQRLAAY
jgi:RimJ/RimL family protein N-acetyltransferase